MKRVALLIVHGMGEQKKYDTLDLFTRHLAIAMQSSSPKKVMLSHDLMTINNQLEDMIRLSYEDDNSLELDTHEFYWAHNTQRSISFGETIQWLIHAADGASKFYDDNEQFAQKYEPFENGRIKKRWYLSKMGVVLRGVYGFHKLTGKVMPGFFDPIVRLLMNKPHRAIADYFGDIACYTNTDMKNKFYPIRQQVLEGTINKIITLMQADYDQVIVLGHSLGSTIAYDALNEINIRMNVNPELATLRNKLVELVTFGSPLDKTAFFLREHTLERECVKRLIYNNKNCFRWRDIEQFEYQGIKAESKVQNLLPHLVWINYWDKNDPAAGHLDFYADVENIQVDNLSSKGIKAHTGYWYNIQMYQDFVKRSQLLNPTVQQPQPAAADMAEPAQPSWSNTDFPMDLSFPTNAQQEVPSFNQDNSQIH